MSSSDATFKTLFSIEVSDLPSIISSVMESEGLLAALKGQLLNQAAQIQWDAILSEVADRFSDLLDMSLEDIMAAAWNKYELLAEYADQTRDSPQESILVPLAEHTLESEHHPSIEVLVDDRSILQLTFAIDLTLTLQGVVLKIQNGKIREIRPGEASGEGSIKCGESVIVSQEFDSASLPGSIRLDPGLEIPSIPR